MGDKEHKATAWLGLVLWFAGVAATQPLVAATSLQSLQYSPDSTLTVSGTQLADDAVADDDLAGTIGTVNLGALTENTAVDAFHEVSASTSEFSLAIPATLDGSQTRPHDVIAYDGTSYSLAVDMSNHGVPRGANLDALARNGNTVYCVFDRTVVLGGTRYEDADVAALDTSAGTFSLAFDASSAGLEAAIGVDGLERLANGNWLFSFDRDGTAGGGVRFDNEDIAEYEPGTGSWSVAYDASSNFSVWERADLDALAATQQPPGELQFSTANQSVNEDAGSVTVTVNRVNGSAGAVAVDYATADGSATAGNDYTAASGTLNWADGDGSSKQITVSITNDGDTEPAEDFDVDLDNPQGGATLGTPVTQTVTINESDQPPGEFVFTTDSQSVNEGAGAVDVTVDRVNGTGGAVSVDYATADGSANAADDYAATSGTLNWADGDGSSKQFSVTIFDDGISEGSEDFSVELSDAGGGASIGTPATQTVTIADDDQQRVRWAQASRCVDETQGDASVILERVNGTSGSVDVAFSVNAGSATTPDDFTLDTSSPLMVPDGQDNAVVDITIADDSDFEGDESFELQIEGASGTAVVGTPSDVIVGIDEDDQPSGVLFRDGFEACPGLPGE